ncbi:MAG: helix-hairpin-helix domain-containing protein, partial [candidate division Zixibacteria bacterium]|nr:helix-hairpin-helix domain-containing protein [candidate division Zixibacteria bacterium]
MFSNNFSRTDRRVLAALALLLFAGVVFNLYKRNADPIPPSLVLSAIEVPAGGLAKKSSRANPENLLSPVDLNRAGILQLERLPGVGSELARRIVEYREKRGGFKSTQELLKVSGIGPKKLAQLKAKVYVSRPPAQPPATAVGVGVSNANGSVP